MKIGAIDTGYTPGYSVKNKVSDSDFSKVMSSQLESALPGEKRATLTGGQPLADGVFPTIGITYKIATADNYTEEDPVVVVEGTDENGNAFKQFININDVNPYSATLMEMEALSLVSQDENYGEVFGLMLTAVGEENMGVNDKLNWVAVAKKGVWQYGQLNDPIADATVKRLQDWLDSISEFWEEHGETDFMEE